MTDFSVKRSGVPAQLDTVQPARWEVYCVPAVPPLEIQLLHQQMWGAKERFVAASLRNDSYEVIYGAIATFSDGSHSKVSLNIPRITEVNRCAESGLVAHLEGQAALGEEQGSIKRLTLIGLHLGDESAGFSTHPNPCARCRDRLQVLSSLGKIAADTEILVIALNQDGALPLGGRLTSYGDLLALTKVEGAYQGDSLLTRDRSTTASAVVEKMQEHFADIALDREGLRRRIVLLLRALQRGKDTTLVAGISAEGCLEFAIARPSVVVSAGKVHSFSPETSGMVTALVEEWRDPFFINFSGTRRPSSVTLQRFLDVMHHLHAKGEEEQVNIVQVSMVAAHRTRFSLDEIDPRREFPLGEGPLHRGRRGLIDAVSGRIRFSSKLGLSGEMVASLVAGVPIERLVVVESDDRFGYSRKTRLEKVAQAQKVLGGSSGKAPIAFPRVTQVAHCDDAEEHIQGVEDSRKRQIFDRLVRMLNGAENLQKKTNPKGESRYPICAVLGATRSGELVPRFEFVSPYPTGFEEHGVDPLIQALAELLFVVGPDDGPDTLHLAWRGFEPRWAQEHEELLQGVQNVLGKEIRLVVHREGA